MIYSLLDRSQKLLARSRFATRLVTALRNQCNCVIGYRHARSPRPEVNGEYWLMDIFAGRSLNFVDVGANIGYWASAFLSRAPSGSRALLFEPSTSAGALLREAFDGNAQVELAFEAVGDERGELAFEEEFGGGETSSLVPGVARPGATTRHVRVVTLDDAFRDRGWNAVDFLKIDAEGFDLHVLRGAIGSLAQRRIKVVQFEYNSSWRLAGSTLYSAFALLEYCGYRVFVLQAKGLAVPNLSRYGEYFRYSNFVAVVPEILPIVEDYILGAL